MDRIIDNSNAKKRRLFLVILSSAILVILILVAFITGRHSKLNVEKDKITTDIVKYDLFQDYISVIASVEPLQTVFIDATEGGKVEQIYVDEGTLVHENDLILKLSNDNLLLEISNNEANVVRAVNEIKNLRVTLENLMVENESKLIESYYDLSKLERQYNNNKELFTKSLISKEEYTVSFENWQRTKKQYELLKRKVQFDSAFMKTRIDASEQEVESMQNNLKLVRARLDKLNIRAPVNGELASLLPRVGEVISYGKRIGSINILDSYKLKANIDEHYVSRIKLNLKAECDFSDLQYSAIVKKIYPEVQNGQFAVDLSFTGNIPKEIRIGQTSRVRLELGESVKAMLLARGGFYQSTGGQWVYVLDPSGKKALRRNIRIGRQNPQYYEVLEGLNQGDAVITSGYENFGEAEILVLN